LLQEEKLVQQLDKYFSDSEELGTGTAITKGQNFNLRYWIVKTSWATRDYGTALLKVLDQVAPGLSAMGSSPIEAGVPLPLPTESTGRGSA